MLEKHRMYCSPKQQKTYAKEKTCFSKDALVRLAEAWNKTNTTEAPIKGIPKLSKRRLWQELDRRMHSKCGPGKEWCWVDHLQGARPSKEVAKDLRPVQPKEWTSKPYTWLTNFDIEDVMDQYDFDMDPSFKYKFLGVFPIDFEAKTLFGKCLFEEFCGLDIARIRRKGIKYIGMITNLDKHDQDGSHWTSLFVNIDATSPSFGAYYYDSVANSPPPEVMRFMNSLKEQASRLPNADGKTFHIKWNKVRHQYKGTECGMFSMAYQIRWLTHLKNKSVTTFEEIVNIPLRDEDVHALRNGLFRPDSRLSQQTGGVKKAATAALKSITRNNKKKSS